MNRRSVSDHAAPFLPEVGVMAFVPEAWGGPWQPRHHVLTRLSKYFHVLWVDPSEEWRQVWFAPRRSLQYQDGREGLVIQRQEPWLPKLYRPRWLARWTASQRLRRGQRILRSLGCRKTVLYLWRPEFAGVLKDVPHDASCYHIDDEYSFSPVEQGLDAQEIAVITNVDQVFVHSRELLRKKGHLNPQTLLVPNGVDYQAYARGYDEPSDLRHIPHPRIGYIGTIKTQLDLSLLLSLAERHPDWSWVFVGPMGFLGKDVALCQHLFQLPNVYYLGEKPIPSLPAYTQHVDVCLLCYVANDYTKYIYPLKLHEYLASGRPVVGTKLPALEEFRDVVSICEAQDEWSAAITEALRREESEPSRVTARRRVACRHDWNRLVLQIARALCMRLDSDYLRRLDELHHGEEPQHDGCATRMHQVPQ